MEATLSIHSEELDGDQPQLTAGRTHSLRSDMSSEFVRGVPISVCLSGFGKYFRTEGKDSMFSLDENHYGLSRQTAIIDHFLSHDWATHRGWKYISLLWTFNVDAAVFAVCIASLAVAAGQSAAIRGYKEASHLHMLWPYPVFLLVFAFWQLAPFKERLVFLDRLCIAQHDAHMKARGIAGLATFLRHSKELTILWSPRWITRLWCVYELATFLSDTRRDKQLNLVPVKLSTVFLLQWISWMLLTAAWFEFALQGSGVGYLLFAVFFVFTIGAFCSIGTSIVRDVEKLPRLVQNFEVQKVECYCCTLKHLHPHSGEPIPCDRQMVYGKLRTWFSSRDLEDAQSHLDSFNNLVRKEVGTTVLRMMDLVSFRDAVRVACASNFPWLIDYIPWCVHDSDLAGLQYMLWFLRGFILWCCTGLLMLAMVRIWMALAWSTLPLLKKGCCMTGVVLLQVLGLLIASCLLFFPQRTIWRMTEQTDNQNVFVMLPVFLVLILLNIYLYWPRAKAGPTHEERNVVLPESTADRVDPGFEIQTDPAPPEPPQNLYGKRAVDSGDEDEDGSLCEEAL